MNALFMMPQWEAASEVWMHRMLDGLTDDLVAIAVNDSHGNKVWKNKLPIFSLSSPDQEIRYFSRLFNSFGVSLKKKASSHQKKLMGLIRSIPISHILCQYGTYAERFMEIWNQIDIPFFIHFHGYDATFDLRIENQPKKLFHSEKYIANIRDLANRAILIANSEYTKSLLVDGGISSDKVHVKYYGIPVPIYSKTHTKKNEVQILHLGRLIDFKSPDRTIVAFEIAQSKGLNGKLVLAGDGSFRIICELMRQRSPYRDSIQIIGAVNKNEADYLFQESDIFTQHNIKGEISNQSECFGVSIVEAMAAGLPVVGTKNGGVLETVVSGETGLLVDPGDVESQANAFLELSRNPELRQQMGNSGRLRVAQYFSPQQEIAKLRSIMNLPQ